MRDYLYSLLNCLNKFCNCLLAPLWNKLFLVDSRHPFGRHEEKMSEVFGWAQLYSDLTPNGERAVKLLNSKDSNHCRGAFDWAVLYAENKLKEKTTVLNNNI